MTEPENGQIYGLMAQAMAKVAAVGKDGWNEQQSFSFRSIEAITAAAKAVFVELGISVVPHMVFLTNVPQPMKNGSPHGYRCVIEATYYFYAPDGSFVTAQTVGEGVDWGDKAGNKAMSAAFKYALMQVLCIGDSSDDGDGSSPQFEGDDQEASAPKPAKKAAAKKAPAKKAPAKKAAAPKPVDENPAISKEDWATWEESRQYLLDNEYGKEQLVAWIETHLTEKPSKAMDAELFDSMLTKAAEIITVINEGIEADARAPKQ